jgi:hypothetical protein
MSVDQLHRILGFTYKAAWFMAPASAKPWRPRRLPQSLARAALSRLMKPRSAESKEPRQHAALTLKGIEGKRLTYFGLTKPHTRKQAVRRFLAWRKRKERAP